MISPTLVIKYLDAIWTGNSIVKLQNNSTLICLEFAILILPECEYCQNMG